MIHKEVRIIPAYAKNCVVKTTCDICGEEIKTKQYEIDEVTIQWKKGSSYPEGGSGETTILDICSKCFENKILPLLKDKLNITPRTEEWDW